MLSVCTVQQGRLDGRGSAVSILGQCDSVVDISYDRQVEEVCLGGVVSASTGSLEVVP